MRFDLADLSLFRHVIDAGSITRGAERAHLALAAASTRIRHMEETLGATLLVRTRQGVTPTQAGRTSCSMPGSSCARRSACARTSAPIRAASPARSGSRPTPMR